MESNTYMETEKDKRDKKECSSCLWAGCECTNGSMFKVVDKNKNELEHQYGTKCIAWTYYD